MRRWTRPSERARPASPTSSSTSARATRPASARVRHGWASTKPLGSSRSRSRVPFLASPHTRHIRRIPMKRLALVAALSLFAASAFAAPVTYKLDPHHTMVLPQWRSEEHTSDLQSLIPISYDVFRFKKTNTPVRPHSIHTDYTTS